MLAGHLLCASDSPREGGNVRRGRVGPKSQGSGPSPPGPWFGTERDPSRSPRPGFRAELNFRRGYARGDTGGGVWRAATCWGSRRSPGQVTSWTQSFSVWDQGQRSRTGCGATRESPAGHFEGADPGVAGDRGRGEHPDFSKHGDSLVPTWMSPEHVFQGQELWPGGSGCPRQGGSLHSQPRGLWLILEPFWASVSRSAKEGKAPPEPTPHQPVASTGLSEAFSGLRGGGGLCKLGARLEGGWEGDSIRERTQHSWNLTQVTI